MSTPPPGQPGQPGQFDPQGQFPGRFGPPGGPGQPPPPGYAAPFGQPGHPGQPGYPGQSGYPGFPGGYQAPPADPLVATDFSSWFQRVFDVLRRDFVQLALIWALPALALGVYSAAINLVLPGPEESARLGTDMANSADPGAAAVTFYGDVFGRLVPILLIFMVVWYVLFAVAQAVSTHLAVRSADGRPGTALTSLKLVAPRIPAAIGWTAVAAVVTTLGTLLLFLPGAYLAVVIFASLYGVVVFERAGIGRCFRLIKGRFWATTGRIVIALLIFMVYSVVLGIVSALVSLASPVAAGLINGVLMLPGLVFYSAVFVVLYAELRRHENPAVTTATLAAELDR